MLFQKTEILYRNDLSLGARLIYVMLQHENTMRYDRAHDHGDGGKPLEPLILTSDELAERIGKSVYSVRNYLNELKTAGYITTKIHNAGAEFSFTAGFNPANDTPWQELWA